MRAINLFDSAYYKDVLCAMNIHDRAIQISMQLLKFPTVTPADLGCMQYIADFLQNLNFHIHNLDKENIKNMFAVYKGLNHTNNKHICFAGHTDVVPTGDNWMYPPFTPTIENGFLYGRGTSDMKCTIACWLACLEFMHNNNQLSDKFTSVLLTSDEEAEAVNGLRTTVDFLNNQKIDLFMLGEPTAINHAGDCVKIGRRGSVTAVIKIYGKQGHIAYPEFAQNPIDIADAIYYSVKEYFTNSDCFPFGPCRIERTSIDVGNMAENVIPGIAVLKFGIRFNPNYTMNMIKELIEKVCQEKCGQYELQISQHGNPFVTKDANIIEWLKDILGTDVILDAKGATSDGRFLHHIAPVIECGFLEKQAHQVNEYVSLVDIEKMCNIYLNMLK